MILKKTYIKRISDFKESPTFFASLRERLGSKEAAILDSLLSGLEQSCPY